jgi:hypothetical protein
MRSKIREQAVRHHEEKLSYRVLRRLEADLDRGRYVRALPKELARAMLVTLGQAESLEEEIEGVVAL